MSFETISLHGVFFGKPPYYAPIFRRAFRSDENDTSVAKLLRQANLISAGSPNSSTERTSYHHRQKTISTLDFAAPSWRL